MCIHVMSVEVRTCDAWGGKEEGEKMHEGGWEEGDQKRSGTHTHTHTHKHTYTTSAAGVSPVDNLDMRIVVVQFAIGSSLV